MLGPPLSAAAAEMRHQRNRPRSRAQSRTLSSTPALSALYFLCYLAFCVLAIIPTARAAAPLPPYVVTPPYAPSSVGDNLAEATDSAASASSVRNTGSTSNAASAAPASFCDEDPVAGFYPDWSDEFDGTELNTTHWTYIDGFESQYAWACGRSAYCTPDNVRVRDGELTITVTDTPRGNLSFSSGGVSTQYTHTFSRHRPYRLCVRARLPGIVGLIKQNTTKYNAGFLPAAWMPSVDGCVPDDGEVRLNSSPS